MSHLWGHVQRPAESHTLTHCSTKALSLQPLQGGFRKPIAWAGRPCPAGPAGPGARRPASESLFAISDLLGDEAVGGGKPSGIPQEHREGPLLQVAQLSHPLTQTKPLTIHSRQPALSPAGKNCTRGLVALVTAKVPGQGQDQYRPKECLLSQSTITSTTILGRLRGLPAPSPSLMRRHSRGTGEGSGPGRCLQRRSAGNLLPRREPQGGAPGRLPGRPCSARGSASSLSICLTEGARAFGFLATPQELAGFSRGAHSPEPPPLPPPPRFRDLKSLQRPQRTTGRMT